MFSARSLQEDVPNALTQALAAARARGRVLDLTVSNPTTAGLPYDADGIVSALDAALETHELVKVRIGTECPDDRHAVAEKLPPRVRAELGQALGRTLLLYRRHPKEPKISLPKA